MSITPTLKENIGKFPCAWFQIKINQHGDILAKLNFASKVHFQEITLDWGTIHLNTKCN